MAKIRKPSPPIQTYAFYTEKEDDYYLQMSKEFTSMNSSKNITLYAVNIVKTQKDDLYGEATASEKKFMKPVVLSVTIEMEPPETKSLTSNGQLNNTKIPVFKFGVWLSDLKDKQVSIKRGDYVKYFDGELERFFEVYSASNIKTLNSLLGVKPAYQSIECTMVLGNVIMED